jgi:hypothetical protein
LFDFPKCCYVYLRRSSTRALKRKKSKRADRAIPQLRGCRILFDGFFGSGETI